MKSHNISKLAQNQYTIPTDAKLNEIGNILLQDCEERYEKLKDNKNYTNRLNNWFLTIAIFGPLPATEGGCYCLNSWNNSIAVGDLEKDKQICTSIVVMADPQKKMDLYY